MEDGCIFLASDTDLDLSFTTDRTFNIFSSSSSSSSSARSSLARSSLTLSFNDRHSITSTTHPTTTNTLTAPHPHRHADPHWTAINTAKTLSSDGNLHLRHLKLIRLLGTGNLGRVYLCRLRISDDDDEESPCLFALKVVDTAHLSSKKLSHVEMEAHILSILDHPFLPTLYANITASHYTCLLIDYCPGGDLHSLLTKHRRLSLQAVRFFAAEVLVALEYLHALGIVYRDLKPENILLRQDGHLMLSDFDLCFKAHVVPTFTTTTRRKYSRPSTRRRCGCGCFATSSSSRRKREKDRRDQMVAEFVAEPTTAYSQCCVGTHEYLAPELLSSAGHGSGVDWWAFGVLIYELLYGITPFKGESKESTLRNIASSEPARFHVSADHNNELEMAVARDLIEKLLVKEPRRRLGCIGGATHVKRHPFFEGIKWPLIRCYRPPPEVRGLIRKSKSIKTHVIAPAASHRHHYHMRRRWWWKGLAFILRAKWSKRSNYYSKSSDQSNGNYYRYNVT